MQKKKLIQINTVCNTSTGRIMGDIQREAERQGYEAISFVGRRKPFEDIKCVKFGNLGSFWVHVAINTVFDKQGNGSFFSTKRLLNRIREEKPDIIHLHNLHGYYLNIPLLFDYLDNEFNGKVFWTFHDCWPFTGHCAYFTMAGCDKWKQGCHHCPNKMKYPVSLILDSSSANYQYKKQIFCQIDNLTILTPSKWMAGLVKESFFKEKKVAVVPNGIDLNTFCYTENPAILRKYGIPEDKKILLGVANVWDERKGLTDFIRLSEKLTERYQIVLVGLSRGQIRKLPANMTGIMRTENKQELAVLYSRADVFINPSLEESFSLVTVEAFACGTPVIVLDTSAVKELVNDENGVVLSNHDTQDYLDAIRTLEQRKTDRDVVAKCAEKYDNRKNVSAIINMYEEPL